MREEVQPTRPPDGAASGSTAPLPAATLAHLLDCVTEGVVVVGDGALLYQNAEAERQLADPEGALAREVTALAARARATSPGTPVEAEVLDGDGRYALRARQLATAALPDPPGTAAPVVVTLAGVRPALPSPESLMRRFALSAREASIARHLAEGHRNATVARALGISESTARHYTESTFLKLGVHTRGAVAAVVLGHAAPSGHRATPRRDRGRS